MKGVTLEQARQALTLLRAMAGVAGKGMTSPAVANGAALAMAQISLLVGLTQKKAHKLLDEAFELGRASMIEPGEAKHAVDAVLQDIFQQKPARFRDLNGKFAAAKRAQKPKGR